MKRLSVGPSRPVETSDLHPRCHHPRCRPPHVLAVESAFRRRRALRRNQVQAELYRHRQALHEPVAPTTLALLAAHAPGVVQRVARVDRIALAAREAHVALVAQVAQVAQVAHRPAPTVQEAVPEAVPEDLEVDLSRDAAANKSVVDVSRKNCSHKSWQRIRQSTPRYPRVRLLLSEVQRRRK